MTREHADLNEEPSRASKHFVDHDETPEDLEDLALGDDYALNPEYVRKVIDAADRGDAERLRELVGALRSEDVADLMGFLTADYREEVVPCLDSETLAEVISELDDNLREEVLETVHPTALAKALEELDSDDAADVVDDLEGEKRAQVLAAMDADDRAAVEASLSYEDETAGRLMQREVLAAPQFWTVGQTIDHVRNAGDDLPELFFDVYIVDPAYRPIGAAPVSTLLRAKRETSLAEIMEPVTEITVDMDQEEVGYTFNKYHLISAPVVDAGGRLVGQITVDDIVGVIQEEGEEDILALAGVSDAGRDAGVWDVARSRLPWLVVNTLTAATAASVIGAFQEEIAQLVTLAILMPVVASLGGNAGTQTLAVAVRALASRELNAANAVRIVLREMAVGLVNGGVLAVIMGVATFAVFQDWKLCLTIGLALIINLFVAALAGILVPLTLDKLDRDPAVSSSVFVTFTTDFMGFLSFLGLAGVLLL
ncbi:magnesium transporter [Caulobacter mirabilis]|uniref:Magnesium transporter MgtE n=1 Tax=Caulobacter mirabilis TaxID=69666 RepID=A0A2D2AX74_9CAUL|nr:magnesium transporter [Caulobacter mirabilis]ATQ42614.1 magnesium transporter [Caulobacter mirabilis]